MRSLHRVPFPIFNHMKEKILIIPDIHHRVYIVEKMLVAHPDATKVIFLGDYFDDYNDSAYETTQTARWLKEKMKDEKNVFLWGNHDISYSFHSRFTDCSGYTIDKHEAVRAVIRPTEWDKIKFHYFMDDILLTHAGLHKHYAPNKDLLREYLTTSEEEAQLALRRSQDHWFYTCGLARYGPSKYGGPVWCDANMEFIAIPGVSQIFGHTIQKIEPLVITRDDNVNICLDTNLRHYIVYEDKKVNVLPTPHKNLDEFKV